MTSELLLQTSSFNQEHLYHVRIFRVETAQMNTPRAFQTFAAPCPQQGGNLGRTRDSYPNEGMRDFHLSCFWSEVDSETLDTVQHADMLSAEAEVLNQNHVAVWLECESRSTQQDIQCTLPLMTIQAQCATQPPGAFFQGFRRAFCMHRCSCSYQARALDGVLLPSHRVSLLRPEEDLVLIDNDVQEGVAQCLALVTKGKRN
eukprot:1442144-Amphidinium_carterae.2